MTDRIVVSCRNEHCPEPAPRTTVTMPVFAPGIFGVPRLLCAGCGWELYQHHEADQQQ